MQKIMFSDAFKLTKAVLEGRKTQTRRFVGEYLIDEYETWLDDAKSVAVPFGTIYESIEEFLLKRSRFKIGEVVAIAQSYKDCGGVMKDGTPRWDYIAKVVGSRIAGWENKMYVKASLMPHQIRITNVRVQRLQDISDEDCLKEGIEFDGNAKRFYCDYNKVTNSKIWLGNTPRESYAALIDKVSGKGTWESNPYVWAYDFELVR